MKRTFLTAAPFAAALLAALLGHTPHAGARGGHQHDHQHGAPETLGRVSFRVSCSPEAQARFNRAVAWLHSFEYEEAEKAFQEVAAADPRCAMAYWGVAMSNYHPIWAPPSAAELEKGARAVERAGRSARRPGASATTFRP